MGCAKSNARALPIEHIPILAVSDYLLSNLLSSLKYWKTYGPVEGVSKIASQVPGPWGMRTDAISVINQNTSVGLLFLEQGVYTNSVDITR